MGVRRRLRVSGESGRAVAPKLGGWVRSAPREVRCEFQANLTVGSPAAALRVVAGGNVTVLSYHLVSARAILLGIFTVLSLLSYELSIQYSGHSGVWGNYLGFSELPALLGRNQWNLTAIPPPT